MKFENLTRLPISTVDYLALVCFVHLIQKCKWWSLSTKSKFHQVTLFVYIQQIFLCLSDLFHSLFWFFTVLLSSLWSLLVFVQRYNFYTECAHQEDSIHDLLHQTTAVIHNPIEIMNTKVSFRFIVFNAIFNNFSAILWWSVLLVDETSTKPPNMSVSQVTDNLHCI